MGGVYSVIMSNQTIIASADLVIIHTDSTLASAGSNIRILRAWCSQIETETSQQLGSQLCLQASAYGTYTGATPSARTSRAARPTCPKIATTWAPRRR